MSLEKFGRFPDVRVKRVGAHGVEPTGTVRELARLAGSPFLDSALNRRGRKLGREILAFPKNVDISFDGQDELD